MNWSKKFNVFYNSKSNKNRNRRNRHLCHHVGQGHCQWQTWRARQRLPLVVPVVYQSLLSLGQSLRDLHGGTEGRTRNHQPSQKMFGIKTHCDLRVTDLQMTLNRTARDKTVKKAYFHPGNVTDYELCTSGWLNSTRLRRIPRLPLVVNYNSHSTATSRKRRMEYNHRNEVQYYGVHLEFCIIVERAT